MYYYNYSFTIIYSFNKMKKQKSSIIVLSCSESSGDESEKAKPKIDKEELRKYLQNSDEEDESPQKTSPKSQKNLSRKEKLLLSILIIKINQLKQLKNQRNSLKKTPQKYLLKGEDFKRLQKKAKKLGASSLDYSKRKNNKYMVEYDNKKIHFSSANTEDFIIHKDPDRREKYLTKAMKISNKDGQLTHQLPSYPNYWSVKLLNLKKKKLKK